MRKESRKNILSTVSAEKFIGRSGELDSILRHSKNQNETPGMLVFSQPAVGASEILRQVYDKIFFQTENETIPIYFAFKSSDETNERAAVRFLHTFLRQFIAFRRGNAEIIKHATDLCELAEIAVPKDGYWIDRLVNACQIENKLNNETAFVRNCLSAPFRAYASGAKIFVMLDDLHEAVHLSGESNIIEEIKEIFTAANFPFVFCGRRRFVQTAMRTGNARLSGAASLNIEALNFSDAGQLAENLAEKYQVKINEQTRDLIHTQFDGNPTFIQYIFQQANEKKENLDGFQFVEKAYADSVYGGRIGKFYDSVFEKITPDVEIQKNFIGLLYDANTVEREKTPIEFWKQRSGLNNKRFYQVVNNLNFEEIVRVSSNLIEAMAENEVLKDYIEARFRLEILHEPRVLVVAESLVKFLKRAPDTMAKFYRRNSAIGLRELLSVFNCQETPKALLDYQIFRQRYKGAEDAEILEHIRENTEKIVLPQIVYTAHTVSFYQPISQVTDTERSAVALGFEQSKYTDENEIVWISAEIDSKLEASKELAEFWCDRLEMVALMCNFKNYKIWLVAPEGFSPEGLEVLNQRKAFGSSKKQIDLLVKFLDAESILSEKVKPNEYEMIVPMGEDTELIAAHAVEEIARRHSFEPKAINQIKTALVEAFINAEEHSLSPDRKIYQKFTVEDDKIVITISNRGLRFDDKKSVEIMPDEGRRGWGLKLMKTLMDDVKFEQVDNGTRISMTKFLKKQAESKK